MITTNVNGQPISQAFIDQIRSDSPDVISRILLNGSVLSADIRNWTLEKGSVASSEQFSTGDAIGFRFTAEVANLASNIKGGELEIQVGAWTGSAYEYIRLGYVTVKECSKIRQTVNESSIVAYGRIVTRTKGQITVSGAVTIASLISSIQTITGLTVTIDTGIDTSKTLTIGLNPISAYQGLQAIAYAIGGYVCDMADGSIGIHKFTNTPTLSVDTGMMIELPNAEESNFVITGVQCGSYSSGSPINVEVENDFVTPSSDCFSIMASNLIGYSYRPAEIDLTLGDPRLEGNDVLSVTDVDESVYSVPCHSLIQTYTGGFHSFIQSAKATFDEDDIASDIGLNGSLRVVAGQALERANEALELSGETQQYFWFDSNTGAHITEVPQSTFIDTPSGANVLIDSNSMEIRDGTDILASFGASLIKLAENDSTAVIDLCGGHGQIFTESVGAELFMKIWATGLTIPKRVIMGVREMLLMNVISAYAQDNVSLTGSYTDLAWVCGLENVGAKVKRKYAITGDGFKDPLLVDPFAQTFTQINCTRSGLVLISIRVEAENINDQNILNINCCQNGTMVFRGSSRASGNRAFVSIPQKVIEVEANDVLTIQVSNSSSTSGVIKSDNSRTYFTMQYINDQSLDFH